MRHGHWLPGNERTRIPRWHLCVSVDCEREDAAGDVLTLEAWHARVYDAQLHRPNDECLTGRCSNSFWGTVQAVAHQARSTLWVWFGRAAVALPALEFTRQVELGRFVRRFWVWGDPPTVVRGKLGGQRVNLLCASNWMDLSDLSQALSGAPANELVCHVANVLHLVESEDLGSLRSTIGSQSLQAFRHKSLPGKIGIHDSAPALALERECCLAQTLRVCRHGEVTDPIYVCDVNALYPYVMGNYPFPRKLLWTTGELIRDELCARSSNALLIARVSGADDAGDYLVSRKGASQWVTTLRHDVLAGPDLDRALWTGAVEQVHAAAAYEAAGVFVRWSEWALELRRRYSTTELAPLRPLVKRLTNALWGTFAGRLGRWEPWEEAPNGNIAYGYWWHHEDGAVPTRCRTIAGQTDRWVEDEEPQHSFPALAAFTAAYARYYMAGVCAIVGWEHIHYVAADCLHLTREGYRRLGASRLIHQTQPGKLKLVRVEPRAYYHAPNAYQIGSQWVISGRPVLADQTAERSWEWRAVQELRHAVMRLSGGQVQTLRRTVTLGEAAAARLS